MTSLPRALTIAGSDSGGCAGIQADLKTFAAFAVHGMSVITSITAQNTQAVVAVHHAPVQTVEQQIRAVLDDIGARAVKTGMLATTEIILAVARLIEEYRIEELVVDPVMVSTSGHALIETQAIRTLEQELAPLARVVTPNLQEMEILAGHRIQSRDEIRRAAQSLLRRGARAVVVKGGHLEDASQSIDWVFEDEDEYGLAAPRIPTRNTHGSGCTFASAIAAGLAQGHDLRTSLLQAKRYVTQALQHGLTIGSGRGPLGHFYRWWGDVGLESDKASPDVHIVN